MFQKTTLKNGTRVVLVPDDHTKAATVYVLYRVGSRYEEKKHNGVSHFIEHLMFKGTPRRPSTADISRELDGFGAEYNAFTGKDVTGYYVKIDSRRLPQALDILHDMLYKSKFDAKEIDQERKVIMEEIYMYNDNPHMHIEDMIETLVFEGNPLGWHIAGDEKSMSAITRPALLAFRDKYYQPGRTVVVAAGALGPETLTTIERLFGGVPKKKSGAVFPKYRGVQKKPRSLVEYKEVEQVQLALAFPAYAYGHRDLPALGLLANILGGTMSSRLFIEVRERKALAYSVNASAEQYEDTGSFQIRSGLNKARIDEAVRTICGELAKMKKKAVTSEELLRAKENIRGRMVLSLEDSSDLAGYFGRQELYLGKIKTPEERFADFNAVTASDIRRVANDVLKKNKASLALIGPFKESKRFEKLLAF